MRKFLFRLYVRSLIKFRKIEKTKKLIDDVLDSNTQDFEILKQIYQIFILRYPIETMDLSLNILNYLRTNGDSEAKSFGDYNLAVIQYRNYKFNEVIDLTKDYKDSARHLDYLIAACLKLKKFGEAKENIELSKRIWALSPDAVFHTLRLLDLQGKFDEMESLIFEYLDKAPKLSVSHFFAAQFFVGYKSDFISGERYLKNALKAWRNDENYRMYDHFGSTTDLRNQMVREYSFLLGELNGIDEAVDYAKSKLSYIDFQQYLPTLYMRLKLFDASYSLVKELLRNTQSLWKRHHFLSMAGLVALRMEKFDEAAIYLKESVELGEQLLDPFIHDYIHLAICYDKVGKQGGEELIEVAFGYSSQQALNDQIEINFLLGNWEETINLISFYCKRYQHYPISINEYLGYAYFQLGDYDAASKEYEALLLHQPHNISAILVLAKVYKASSKQEKLSELGSHLLAISDLPKSKVEEIKTILSMEH